ncbi:response regulator [Roseomonas sp. GC11]|uniref:ATP-binding protein n=1 Tax=Roseomonas sp. GC11 TaxID=2950546 RepID=UPI00210D4882|nr:ATP-binding protein [Roseomonas sp. GC11]MCQ4160754.1 response regulator [Roseomonas sp. GC11]
MLQFRRIRLAILLAAMALLLGQWFATSLLVGRAREAALSSATDTVNRIARAVEASLNRNLVQVDAMLAGLPAMLAPLASGGTLDNGAVNRVLRELNNQNFTFRDVLLIGADGMPVATGLAVSRRRPLPFALEGAFVETAPRAGAVLIGGPFRNPATGEWSLFMARRITMPELGPLLAVAELPVPVIGSLLAVGGEGAGLRITLERDDGTLLASLPHDETRIGTRLSPPLGQRLQEAGANAVSEAISRFDSDRVLTTVRPLLYPALSLSASMKLSSALASWENERSRALIVSLAFAALVAALGGALILALRQRERVEAERARWRAMLENALDSMSDGFVMWDANDRLVACNARYKDFYKVSAPFIEPGSHFDDIMREGFYRGQYPQAGDDLDAFLAEMRRWHRGDNPPMERLLPDGRWVLITERATPGGGTVGIRTDITELKRAMEELARARDEAAAAGEAKTQFLARMSHELRTPLNGVLGFAQVLLNDPRVAPDQREQLRTLHEAARHLLELVNGLLDLSKIAAGRLELQPAPAALVPLLERCTALLAPEVQRKSQALLLEVAPDLPAGVMADATRLRQLLLNLLSNAVKFTPAQGRVTLRARRAATGGIRLEVEDTGPGVPPGQRHLLFRDFVQLATPGASNAEAATGTGLGLSIAAQLAELMGGSIGCDSPPGRGATFWVELPLPPATLPPPEPDEAAPKPVLPGAAAQASAQPLQVLVVDDVPANRLVARAMLTSAGHHVTCVEDGAAALAAVQQGQFDLVLMDLQMPVMDGLEATRRIRTLAPPRGRVPVLAVTASAMPEQVEACRQAGMDGHLAKPIDRETLLRMVRQFADAHPVQAGPTLSTGAALPLLDDVAGEALVADLGPAAQAVLVEFVAELERGRESLAQLTPALDIAPLRATTHRLLGVARTMGARRLARALEDIQRNVAQGNNPAEALAQARQVLEETLPALRAWVRRQTAQQGRAGDPEAA